MKKMQRSKFGGSQDRLNCVKTQFEKGWKGSIDEKGNMYVLGKHKPKMIYLTTFYLSHTL